MNSLMNLYRFEFEGVGIYEAVDNYCPRNDSRRENKPDGSWLPKEGPKFPTAVSFWTEIGLEKYRSSGLMAWHLSILPGEATVICALLVDEPAYQDKYQVITHQGTTQRINVKEGRDFL